MKDEKNQRFRAAATVIVLSFLGTLGLSLLAPQSTHDDEEQKLVSYQKARSIAQTIAVRLKEESQKLDGKRIPASNDSAGEAQGYMGTDEAGQPYHYSVLQTDAGVARVVVRSGGPKGRIEYIEEGGKEMPLPEQDRFEVKMDN